ncbi:MAG: BrnA antitoxin family protein [Candidatus Sulfotelmatobacter sp.]
MSPTAIRKGILADPEAHPTDEAFWRTAKVVLPTPKEIVTMRLDADLLRWFRQHRGYQTRINAILRAYMEAQS